VPVKNINIELSNPAYVPILKDSHTSYGGSQMWFPEKNWHSRDYIIHNYGCGTIATADLFLYLAMQNQAMQTPLTASAIYNEKTVKYENYDLYVRNIDINYTHTKHLIAVLGPSLASAINAYSQDYGLGLKANWRWKLSYYDMLDIIEEMLQSDIPVILSIGPNWPNLMGKKGISFYERKEIDIQATEGGMEVKSKPYYYQPVKQGINSHYVAVTGIIKDDIANKIMLRISSWGKMYFINYEEYREYIETSSTTWMSSLAQVTKK